MKQARWYFFQNTDCPYFPCHKIEDSEYFNCIFCFCPLYALGENCGGDFCYTEAGIKDCSVCNVPHGPDGYERILEKLPAVTAMAEKGALKKG